MHGPRMRSVSLALALTFLVACGDDGGNSPTDGPMGDTHLGTKCDDGIDNDGDGKTDYPEDPGCAVPNADDEADDCPDGPHCPQCSNGRDDDGNGSMDYPGDFGCESAGDPTEVTINPVACGATLMIKDLPVTGSDTGTLGGSGTTSTSQITSTCGGGGGAAAIAYRIVLTQPAVIVASTAGSQLDTVLDLRSSMCSDPSAELTCHDDVDIDDTTSRITRSVPAGTYYLIVEGADTSETGAYTITVEKKAGEGVSCSDTSQCGPTLVCRTPYMATAMICTQPQCGDTLDDDQDGKNGYPTDPGCASPADNDETDPNPLPACADGADNDNDGQTDYPMDTSCTSASGQSEACNGEQDPILPITAATTNGTLVGSHDDHDAACDDEDDSGNDVIYALTIPAMRTLSVEVDSNDIDWVTSILRPTCAEPSLTCAEFDTATATNLDAGTYLIAVDNYYGGSTIFPDGPFTLTISGVIAPGGACNPADTFNGALACPAMNPCEGTTGNLKCRVNQCSDGLNNDADTKIDYPFDPGCATPEDNDETDPGTAPVCSNGLDDDNGGGTDFPADYGCSSAGGASEVFCAAETNPTSLITTTPVMGTTVGATNNFAAQSCAFLDNSGGPDVALALALPVPVKTLTLDLRDSATGFDTQISLRDAQCGTELGCNEDEPESLRSYLEVVNVPAGNYAIIIDGYGTGASNQGAYELDINGVVASGTSCSSPLFTAGVLSCPTGTTCTGTPMRCQ